MTRQSGFTLIELLVSLALLALASGLLLAGLTTGRGLTTRAEARAAAGEQVAAAQMLLRARLETMIPDSRFDASAPYVDVRGDGAVLSFTAPAAAGLRPSPPLRNRIILSTDGTLTLYTIDPLSQRINPDAPAVTGWTRAPLLSNVASLTIAYFGVGPPDNGRRWRGFWQDRPALPELVRVRIGFPAGDARVWPDLIVRPAATVASACRLDALTGRCRRAPA